MTIRIVMKNLVQNGGILVTFFSRLSNVYLPVGKHNQCKFGKYDILQGMHADISSVRFTHFAKELEC